MADFFRVNPQADNSFMRGAARLMIANITVAFPTGTDQIINMSTFDAIANSTITWVDLGSTKTGIQISTNNTEETFSVDQVLADIDRRPTNWSAAVQTQLADVTLQTLQSAWEMSAITSSGGRDIVSFGTPLVYVKRRLAVLFPRPSGKVRAFVFRTVTHAAQESAITFNKDGDQISVPVRFEAIADTSVADPYARLFTIFDDQ